jgi:hypothetical protein
MLWEENQDLHNSNMNCPSSYQMFDCCTYNTLCPGMLAGSMYKQVALLNAMSKDTFNGSHYTSHSQKIVFMVLFKYFDFHWGLIALAHYSSIKIMHTIYTEYTDVK